jgi:hypothetical protein
MEPVSALKVGTEAVSLVSALAKLIKEAKSDAPTPLNQVLGRLQVDAVRLSRDLENRIRNLVENVHEYGLNPALSLEQQLSALTWYNFVTRSRIKAFREECFSAYRQLTSFIDDATAMLICEQRINVAGEAFKASLAVKRQLDELFLKPNIPIRTILEGMLGTASRVSAELQDA